jgi:hypothetical protein
MLYIWFYLIPKGNPIETYTHPHLLPSSVFSCDWSVRETSDYHLKSEKENKLKIEISYAFGIFIAVYFYVALK